MAIKKGVLAFVLGLVGFLVASYVGLSFIPKISIGYELNKAIHLFSSYLQTFQFGKLTVTLSFVIFIAGLGIGVWKG